MTDSLDITGEAMSELSAQAVALVRDYFERISELPVFPGWRMLVGSESKGSCAPAPAPDEAQIGQ